MSDVHDYPSNVGANRSPMPVKGEERETAAGKFTFDGRNWIHNTHLVKAVPRESDYMDKVENVVVPEPQGPQIQGVLSKHFSTWSDDSAEQHTHTYDTSKYPCTDCKEQPLPTMKDRPAVAIFNQCTPLLLSKAHDYTTQDDYHYNFKYSAQVAEPFPFDYIPYAVLIGTKLSRLAVLLSSNAVPKHESIADSFVDIINYIALMYERYVEETGETK